MKSVNAAVSNAIRTAHDVKAIPRLTAEWNMNRYSAPTVYNNMGAGWQKSENDVDHFPIDSIVEPIRPSKGINKARINQSTISDSYNSPAMPRYYVAGLEDKYKYWVSPFPSDSAGNIGNCVPTVIYDRLVKTNKIVVTVENSWATPITWSIQTSVDAGGSWQTASSAPVIGGDGRAILYFVNGSWSSTKPAKPGPSVNINGLRLVVTRLGGGLNLNNGPTFARVTGVGGVQTNGTGSLFSLIELSPRYEVDLSSELTGISDTFDAGDTNQVTPVGTITSNVGNFSIWNGDNTFSASMEGLLEPNVKINVEHVYHVNGVQYPVQQASMYTESWNETEDSEINVEMTDSSKYLKEIYPMEAKYENLTLAQIVYRLCDSVGFTDYNIVNYANLNDFRIPIFWTDGSETIWEVFDQLAQATQSLIYFDAWGRLNIKSRENAYNRNRPVDWTLRGVKAGNELPDIESLEKSNEFDSNVIKVKYKKVTWAEEVNGHVQNTVVWSPEDTTVLRATPLLEGLPPGKGWFTISPGEAPHWPYEGHVQIEGEFIEFSGKHFNYRENGQWKWAWVHDQKEYESYNEKGGDVERQYNNFSGHLKVKERAVWNSRESDHTPEAKGWDVRLWEQSSNFSRASRACWQWFRGSSMVRLSSNGQLKGLGDWAIATRDTGGDNTYRHFGTRFRFNGAGLHHRGGIMFNQGANGDGYYVEVRPTNTIENKDRDNEDEVIIYAVHNGNTKQMKSKDKPHDLIVADRWHDLAVTFDENGHRISVWLDGKLVMTDNILPTNYRHAMTSKFGMFIRGQTNMDFEYFYALHAAEPELSDDVSFLDRTRGAYAGDVWQHDRVYRTGTRSRWVKRKGKKKQLVKNEKYDYAQFMDEFGPIVHEVREFDVKFDPSPVKSAYLYFSNDWQAVCPEFRSDAFGAYFILANTSRTNAVVQGDDDLSFAASGTTVPQQLLVYGRALVMGEDEEVEVRNEEQIRARGEIIADIDSPWIQSEGAAQAVADWITAHWSKGADELSVQVFGNTLFEVGDLVAVEHPKKGYSSGTHQYFITGIDTEFDAGITTKLTLQRKN